MTRFEFDPMFEDNIYRASNKSNSSLRPLYDKVRNVADHISSRAKTIARGNVSDAESQIAQWKNDYSKTGRLKFKTAKARWAALNTGYKSIVPTMGYDGKEIFGRVAINRRQSASIEFGGIDPVGEIGKATGEYVNHPAYAWLRRAMDG